MKVLILSTYEKTGGAAIAAQRLMYALNANTSTSSAQAADANLDADVDTDRIEVTALYRKNISWWPGKPQSWTSIIERGLIWILNGFSTKNLWSTDIALLGQDITKTKEFKEADVIHLHWVNQGFLSLNTIDKICHSGKKVVWTMHDEWPLDSIYHYTYDNADDNHNVLARCVFNKKQKIYASKKITFVTCSQWLGNIAKAKVLGQGQNIVSIPNAIDTEIFKPTPHKAGKRVLFVAQDVNDERKGIKYLDEAEKILNSDVNVNDNHIEIVALGRDIPYIKNVEEMSKLYASMDAFVTPSLQDNLPNTIMEAMACGTPCVGFNVGGIPEMIDHKENGYIANYKDANDLAEGIKYVLSKENHDRLSKAAREKVMRCYSEAAVSKKYIEVYKH